MRKQTPIEPTWLHKLLDKNPGEIPEKILSHRSCSHDYCQWISRTIGLMWIVLVCLIIMGVGFLFECDYETISMVVLLGTAFLIWIGYLIVVTCFYRNFFLTALIVERKMRAKLRRGEVELLPENK